jgi:hypothetical protein
MWRSAYLRYMRQLAPAILVLSLAVSPAFAQERPDTEEGFGLMEEGARMLLRGLMTEMEPAISDLRDGFEEMGPAYDEFAKAIGPAFSDLLGEIDDFCNYEVPEFLPNGDIIIRRRPDAPAWQPDLETGEVEL